MMKGFRNFWPKVDSSPDVEVVALVQDLPGKEEAIDFYRNILSTKNRNNVLPRDDYRYIITKIMHCCVYVLIAFCLK